MSVLLMVCALASLFDPEMPPYSIEAFEYYVLARLALRYAPPMFDTTLMAVQSIVGCSNTLICGNGNSNYPKIYMAQYLESSDCEPAHTGSQKAWTTIGYAVHLGHSVRLSDRVPILLTNVALSIDRVA